MDFKIVIGANYGDEGKGTVVDYLTSKSKGDVCVVRFNGGAQSGHTVTTPDGRRHIFSHFGSGTLAGADTILSRFFVCNPMVFRAEHEHLSSLGVNMHSEARWRSSYDYKLPKTIIDPRCAVTTPFDVMINQYAENMRGDNRHGSVGVGFNETIERHGNGDDCFSLSVGDLSIMGTDTMRNRLSDIIERWVPVRLGRLGFDVGHFWEENLSYEVIDSYIYDLMFFLENSSRFAKDSNLFLYDTAIFEGGQGLALDQYRQEFPYVTRSNTGLFNVSQIMGKMVNSDPIDTYYVTRPYLTRHGRGPFPRETFQTEIGINVVDETNTTKKFQEHMRFAPLNFAELMGRIRNDQKYQFGKMQTHLAMTCTDQIGESFLWYTHHDYHELGYERLLDACLQINGKGMLVSDGPTRKHFTVRD
jgi:adenylosuccinate synthase